MPQNSKLQPRSTRPAPLDMLLIGSGRLRVQGRDNHLTDFREFQNGELIAGTRYRVIRLIGVGGMGSVYEVEHVELGKRFVLKALLRELARREDLVARLKNEWRALARLQHTNIVNVTDAGTSDGRVPYYVMERLDGDTLAAHLKRKRRLHVLEAVAVSAQVLDALSAAHDIGIIHRDVKPANIFLAAAGGAVKLLDFGVAKIADATSVVTARGIAVGTPRYMSPEQARGERVDGRSDVYAMGLILFEMIAGVGPYDDARDANELLLAHLAREAPLLSSLVQGIAPELERILASMLAKDCRQRPADARVVARQLRDFAARQRQAPATDAPTKPANYGAATVVAPRTLNLGSRHDRSTRPNGVAWNVSDADLTGSDAALTRPIPGQFTTQVTLTMNTSQAMSTSSVPNTTCVSAPPSFDGSTTVELATLVPAYTPPGFALNAPVSPSQYPPVERPERTEILGELTPAFPADAVPTRTRVPLAEANRPISSTPPPVVDAGRTRAAVTPRERAARFAGLAASVVALIILAGIVFRRGSPTQTAAIAPTTGRSSVEPKLSHPVAPMAALLPAEQAPADPMPVQTSASAESVVAAVVAAPAAPPHSESVQNSSRIPMSKPRDPVAAGTFLRFVPGAAASPAKPKAKAKHAEPAMPASGL